MRSKDRLAELQRAAAAAAEAAGGEWREQEAPSQPPPPHLRPLFDEVERARSHVHALAADTQLARRLHQHPTFHNNKQLQEQLEAAAARALTAAAGGADALRRLEALVTRRNDAAGRMARLQYAAARALYARALSDHHAALALMRDERRALLQRQLALTNVALSDEECESLLESKDLSLFVDNVGAQTAEARRALRDAEARRDELARIEAALSDVRDLFRHLALLVAAQQEQVDSVEYYALQASEHVESGQQQLLKGTVSRAKGRQKKVSLIICVSVGLLVVLLVLVCT